MSAQDASWARAARRFLAGSSGPQRTVRCEEFPPAADAAAPVDEAAQVPPPRQDTALQFENFNKEWRQTSEQDNFDGFRVEAATQVTKYMQAAHTLFLGTQMSENGYIYQFGPAFHSESMRTMLVGRMGLDGGASGRWIQKLGENFEVKCSSQSHLKNPQRNMHDSSLEYNGKSVAWGLKGAWQGAMLLGGSVGYRMLPSLHVGGDLTAVMVGGPLFIGTLGARWQQDQHSAAFAFTAQPDMKSQVPRLSQEIRMQYTRKVSERLSLGTEFKYTNPDKESSLAMAYEYAFRNGRVQGMLDTDGKVSCSVMDYQGMGFSGTIDYYRSDYKFGVLLHIMPPSEGQQPM